MAAICAVAGLLFELLADTDSSTAASAARQAGAAFVAVAALSFVMTVEQRRWTWALAFALGWGAVIALVGWFTASYNQQGEIVEFPFLSGLFAVLLAAPLFQTLRDEGAWRFPYARLHGHAWTDAVIGAASLAFVGVTFLLAWLIAGLFDVIGIDAIKDLLKESWFGWMLAGFAFGAAVGLLRERDALMATLQRLVMVVLGVLAPVLAAALLLFLLSLPFTGLGGLWDSSIPATPMMLLAGAGAILLANAVIGNGTDDRATSRVLRAVGAGAGADRPAAGDHRRSVARPAHRPVWLDPRADVGRGRGRRRDRLRARRLVDRGARPRWRSTTCSARSRRSSRSGCAASPCSSRCRSSTSARSRPIRRWRALPPARSTRGSSTGRRWRSTSAPPAASASPKWRAAAAPTSASSPAPRSRPRIATRSTRKWRSGKMRRRSARGCGSSRRGAPSRRR